MLATYQIYATILVVQEATRLPKKDASRIFDTFNQKLLQRFETQNQPSIVHAYEKATDDISSLYVRYLGVDKAWNREDSALQRTLDYAFIEAVQEVYTFDEVTPQEKASLQTEILGLYHLLVKDGLENLLKKYRETPEGKTDTRPDVLIVAELGEAFIVKLKQKNKENTIAKLDQTAPTNGMEFEYMDPVFIMIKLWRDSHQKILLIDKYKQYIANNIDPDTAIKNLVADKLLSENQLSYFFRYIYQKSENQINGELDYRLETFSFIEKNIPTIDIEGKPYSLHELEETLLNQAPSIQSELYELYVHPDLALQKEKLTHAIKLVLVGGELPDSYPEDLKEKILELRQKTSLFEPFPSRISEPDDIDKMISFVPNSTARLSLSGAYDHYRENGILGEVVLSPSQTQYTQLRHVLMLIKSGQLQNEISEHTNYGGLELNKDRNDFMETQAIALAAGYVFGGGFKENYPKASVIGQELVYFPFFRVKDIAAFRYTSFHDSHKTVVEDRLTTGFNTEKPTSTFVRRKLFSHNTAWAEHCAALPEGQRTPIQAELAKTWQTLLESWSQLVSQYGIYQPSKEERYIELGNASDVKILLEAKEIVENIRNTKGIPFENYLRSVDSAVKQTPELQTKARLLITTFNKEVRTIIRKYSTSQDKTDNSNG